MLGFFRNNFGFGGNNGLTDFKDILGFNVQAPGTRAALFAISCAGADARLPDLPGRSSRSKFGKVLVAIRDAEAAHALPRLSRRVLQAVRVHAVGLHGGRRRRALRAAGRHHQSERVLAGQLDRGGDLGRGRRPRHADRRGDRRGPRQLRQDLLHHRRARALLAVPAGRPVRRGDAAAAARHRRHLAALARAAAGPAQARRARGRRRAAARRVAAGRRSRPMDPTHHHGAALSRRRQRLVRRLPRAQQSVASPSSPARCAPSSARTAPARPR